MNGAGDSRHHNAGLDLLRALASRAPRRWPAGRTRSTSATRRGPHVLAPPLKAQGLAGWPLFVAVALACLLVAWLLHRLVERPFLAWRARAVPSSFMMPPVAPPRRPV